MLQFNSINIFISLIVFTQRAKSTQASPTMTTINTIAYPIKNIEFPAITICSQGAAKDVIDNVLLQQFEEYQRIRGLVAQRRRNQNSTVAGKRKRRSVPSFADNLSNVEVLYQCINMARL